MKTKGFRRLFRTTALTLAALMAYASVGTPRVQAMMAPTQTAATAVAGDRNADLQTIRGALENKMVRERLAQLGMTAEQIDGRLSKLSDQDLHQAAIQIEKQNPAGDGAVGILVVVVLVLLIIYLFKRV